MAKATGAAKAAARKSAPARETAPAKPIPKNEPAAIEPALLELFKEELKDIYWAENQLVKVLPRMQSAATTPALADAISSHWTQTQEHVRRLEQVFGLLGEEPRAKKCDAMEGLTKEGESVIEDTDAGTATRDAGIIIASQKVEHYEIAAYGSLVQLAGILGQEEAAGILAQTLAEEKEADELLTGIAENGINYSAATE